MRVEQGFEFGGGGETVAGRSEAFAVREFEPAVEEIADQALLLQEFAKHRLVGEACHDIRGLLIDQQIGQAALAAILQRILELILRAGHLAAADDAAELIGGKGEAEPGPQHHDADIGSTCRRNIACILKMLAGEQRFLFPQHRHELAVMREFARQFADDAFGDRPLRPHIGRR